MDPLHISILIAGGFACGFINTVAGSGSLITLPLLMILLQLDASVAKVANVANGTNRVAILLQNAVAVGSFRQQRVLDLPTGIKLAVPSALGAFVGALVAVELDEVIMRLVIGVLMFVMLIVILLRPKRWMEQSETHEFRFSWKQVVLFFVVGFYGGFIQAGVGVFLLLTLVTASGFDLVRANAVKVLIVLCFTIIALPVYAINGQVHWQYGLILSVGTMLGAWVASRIAVKRGVAFVRWALITVIACSGVKLCWDSVSSLVNKPVNRAHSVPSTDSVNTE